MDIADTRKCNLWNLRQLAGFLDAKSQQLEGWYQELLDDRELLEGLNQQMRQVRDQSSFDKGIVGKGSVSSIDWFAFERVLLYVLVRWRRPEVVLETGVFYGGNSAFLLAGLHANQAGRLVSIDLPASRMDEATTRSRHPDVGRSEWYDDNLTPGFIIPPYLRTRWELVEGDSLEEIPRRTEQFDLFVHDSEHSHDFVLNELNRVRPRLSPDAVIVADDIDWSNGFLAFCVQQRLLPLLLTDNGKDNLRVRMGVARLGHARNGLIETTGE